MTSYGPAPGIATLDERRNRRRGGWAWLISGAAVTVFTVVTWHTVELPFLVQLWVWSIGQGLYLLWLSSPRFMSARFEAAFTSRAVMYLPAVLFFGIAIGMLWSVW